MFPGRVLARVLVPNFKEKRILFLLLGTQAPVQEPDQETWFHIRRASVSAPPAAGACTHSLRETTTCPGACTHSLRKTTTCPGACAHSLRNSTTCPGACGHSLRKPITCPGACAHYLRKTNTLPPQARVLVRTPLGNQHVAAPAAGACTQLQALRAYSKSLRGGDVGQKVALNSSAAPMQCSALVPQAGEVRDPN